MFIIIRLLYLAVAVSIFTTPECSLASNPGQKRTDNHSSEKSFVRGEAAAFDNVGIFPVS